MILGTYVNFSVVAEQGSYMLYTHSPILSLSYAAGTCIYNMLSDGQKCKKLESRTRRPSEAASS